MYNDVSHHDKLWMTAVLGTPDGAVVADDNALPVDVAPAGEWHIAYVTVVEASYTTLPDLPCRELHLVNEDATSKIQWKEAGASTEFLTLFPGRSHALRHQNANEHAAKSETGAGDLTLKILYYPA